MSKIGIVFSGGPASGAEYITKALFERGAELIGFLGGPAGVVENRRMPIFDGKAGFVTLGTGRDKIETEAQFAGSMRACHDLDGLVVVGGDDSNTNAHFLAEYFTKHGSKTRVVGLPKTIDGDLRAPHIPISFGFHTACRIYAEMIGNIMQDALATRKYYHFIRLMGRSASHVTLECALLTNPDYTVITEEGKSFSQIADEIAAMIRERASRGIHYGVILLPEGLAPDVGGPTDPHGNVNLSLIETEKLLLAEVQKQVKFTGMTHFFGYEGRVCRPTNFDRDYCYALGMAAFDAIKSNLTGVICGIPNLSAPKNEWYSKALPIRDLLHKEVRKGVEKFVIAKALVSLKGSHFRRLQRMREEALSGQSYLAPGPIQFLGPEAEDRPMLLQ